MPCRNGGDRFHGWGIAFLDVSERKKFELELERSNRELQDFAFVASHDLQEPLRKIRTFSNLVMKEAENVLDETSSDYLKRVQRATLRLQELLRALLKYSRVSTQPKPFSKCNLRQAVEEVVGELDLTILRSRGKVEIGDLPVVQADTAQIRQLFQNLLINALKFRKDGVPPLVKVYALPAGKDTCRIAVEDNGIGFDDEFATKIFIPFQRVHGRSSKYEGPGMGLAICRKIVERHGGSIIAQSEPGKGATFIISLPCKQTL
jgi:light-regulated signal transduction histidine kinase (bacteriophytochrome)